jgi:hypothetical protein
MYSLVSSCLGCIWANPPSRSSRREDAIRQRAGTPEVMKGFAPGAAANQDTCATLSAAAMPLFRCVGEKSVTEDLEKPRLALPIGASEGDDDGADPNIEPAAVSGARRTPFQTPNRCILIVSLARRARFRPKR